MKKKVPVRVSFDRRKDPYKKAAAKMFNVGEEEVTPEMRRDAKLACFSFVWWSVA